MLTKILDGKKIALELKLKLKVEILNLRKTFNAVPHLVNILIGEDEAAIAYAKAQQSVAEELGIQYTLKSLVDSISQVELLRSIVQLNADPAVHGIMLHTPVPSMIDSSAAINALSAVKDIEGLNEQNLGRIFLDKSDLIPCTAAAVVELVLASKINLYGKEVVVIGRSEIVGKPVALSLLRHNATVTICHSGTSKIGKLRSHCERADVLIVSIGKPKFIQGEWVKEGAVVIDVGINRVDGKIVGDVDFDSALNRAGFITPVPGGVGPLTSLMMMQNTVNAFKIQKKVIRDI